MRLFVRHVVCIYCDRRKRVLAPTQKAVCEKANVEHLVVSLTEVWKELPQSCYTGAVAELTFKPRAARVSSTWTVAIYIRLALRWLLERLPCLLVHPCFDHAVPKDKSCLKTALLCHSHPQIFMCLDAPRNHYTAQMVIW